MAGPVFVRGYVEIVDRPEEIRHDPMNDLLHALIAAVLVEPAQNLQEILDVRACRKSSRLISFLLLGCVESRFVRIAVLTVSRLR